MTSLESARQRWPSVHLTEEDFVRYIADRPEAPAERAVDLYLACACARGDEPAMHALEEAYFDEVDMAWRRAGALIDRVRQPRREIPIADALLDVPFAGADPELSLIKERSRPRLRAALAEAVAALDDRQRLLFRCELEGRSLDEVARLYDVHVRTVQRWLADARDLLLTELRRALDLGDPGEVESLMRLMRSQLTSSIASLVDH
jgi:RNA polymerase sigma-70 factor, ECF subfamily